MHFRHGQTDGLASWHKREMYMLHLALKIQQENTDAGVRHLHVRISIIKANYKNNITL